ncbi:Pathogenesis-related protein 1 [Apostasia shenzhenica]|uniref:Pathogenesis-related protein 1 n=1 Tax=Apostasia shenzhenica TaxID=1088818 RepID=A0A2I0AQA0_9ASPA|nr:Pathogenesis-related protein 1 [Apostasia shenzhenica]
MSSRWSIELESEAPAGRLFRAAFADWRNLGPKLLPDIFTDISLVSGDGGSGSILQFNFTSAMPFSCMKEMIELLDHEKFEKKVVLLEGAGLGKKFESLKSYFKVKDNGSGCIINYEVTFVPVVGINVSDDFKIAEENIRQMIKIVEGYLFTNPNDYA